MGCSGGCVILKSEDEGDKQAVKIVARLAEKGARELSDRDECCAYCAGIKMDASLAPVSAGKLKRAGRGCPLSIVAYRAAAEVRKGFEVDVIPQPKGAPLLMVSGDMVDPLEDYREVACGCEG